MKLYKLDQFYERAEVPLCYRKHQNLRVDSDGKDIQVFHELQQIEKDISNFVKEGKNLYIFSFNTGNGKTSWSIRLLQAYMNSVWWKASIEKCPALFVNVPYFLINQKNSIGEYNEYYSRVKNTIYESDLVIFDEIGSKEGTIYEIDQLLSIINYRIDHQKSNIFTSNQTPQDLAKNLGDRLYSRIINTSEVLQFFGKDKRNLFK